MEFLPRITQLIDRMAAYPVWQVLIELTVIWVVVLVIFRFVEGTRAAGGLKGLLIVLVVGTLLIRILGQRENFQRLSFLYDNLLGIVAIALVVIFQPELRRGLTRIGEGSLFRRAVRPETEVVDALVDAAGYLSKAKFGALIVVERQTPLKDLAEGGTPMDARVTSRLLQTIFFPGSALHDLAVVIKHDLIKVAGAQLPLADAEDMPDATLGSRHRAAVGVTKESDAIVVVVSEETGTISLAERGRLTRGLNSEELRGLLVLKLNPGLVRKLVGGEAAREPEAGTPAPDHADMGHA
ncbi:MAG: diadenylate cyclase CdaA [Phycisphaeraceae bacterium]|nr:diadenylate cyclase CdaA [Phycisphaeraceae bacterium]